MRALLLVLLLAAPVTAAAQTVIYYRGNILTGVGLTTSHPERVSALAVANGRILATGSDRALLARWPQARRVDLGNAFVLPGFNDAHVHLAEAGRQKLTINLAGTVSLAQMLGRIERAAQSAPPGHWILGEGWDQTLWQPATLPTRDDLDRVTGSRPALFIRVDGHIAVANSAALRIASFTRSTPDPAGGKLDRDATGRLTGILRETAVYQLEQHIPAPTVAERERAFAVSFNDAVCHGVTSVQDYSPGWENFLALAAMEKENRLPIRLTEWPSFNDSVATLEAERDNDSRRSGISDKGSRTPMKDRRLRIGMLKGFMDGSLGSRTAAMLAPYSDDPHNSGIPRYTQSQLNRMTVERARLGFQIGFHAIGDRANRMALDAFAAAEQSMPTTKNLRFRIEHAQVVSSQDLPRFRTLGIIASVQPAQLLTDMRWAAARLGPARVPDSYRWKSFLDEGVVLAFGTDTPVEPITPFRGLYAAITRQNETGTESYTPAERLTIEQAIFAYTQGSAYAERTEQWKGRLAPGFAADFVVLDRDLTRIPARQILSTRVLETVVAGEVAPCHAPQE